MKYLLSILCLFVFSCDSGGDGEVEGCADAEATNFNQNVTIDNDTCQYEIPIAEYLIGSWNQYYEENWVEINGNTVIDYAEYSPFNLCIIDSEFLTMWIDYGYNLNDCPEVTSSFTVNEGGSYIAEVSIIGYESLNQYGSGSIVQITENEFISTVQFIDVDDNLVEKTCTYQLQEGALENLADDLYAFHVVCENIVGYQIEWWQKLD